MNHRHTSHWVFDLEQHVITTITSRESHYIHAEKDVSGAEFARQFFLETPRLLRIERTPWHSPFRRALSERGMIAPRPH